MTNTGGKIIQQRWRPKAIISHTWWKFYYIYYCVIRSYIGVLYGSDNFIAFYTVPMGRGREGVFWVILFSDFPPPVFHYNPQRRVHSIKGKMRRWALKSAWEPKWGKRELTANHAQIVGMWVVEISWDLHPYLWTRMIVLRSVSSLKSKLTNQMPWDYA
jgi:hypothetical protein